MQSPPREKTISEFLSQFFSLLNEEDISYCVLRNYETLPSETGNDIDIWVKDGEQQRFQALLLETTKTFGWDIIKYSPRFTYQGEGDYFLTKLNHGFTVIHIDCWSILYWLGTAYLEQSVFPSGMSFHKKGFWVPVPGLEATVLLLKDLLYHGKVPDKYRNRILDYCNQDSDGFLTAIKNQFSKKTANSILNLARTGRWGELEKRTNNFRWVLMRSAFTNKPFTQFKQWTMYFSGQFRKFLFPKCGIFLVLIGPDGSGKSTTARSLFDSEAAKLFQKKMYFHGHFPFLPQFKDIFAFFKRDRSNEPTFNYDDKPKTLSEPFGAFRSIIYPIYYGLNYFLGNILIWKQRAKGGLVVFDRYFYDYFFQYHFKNCPKCLLSFITKFIPSPDALIFLKNTPRTIYQRKPVFSLDEIRRQSIICQEITEKSPNGFIVKTSRPIERVVEEIQHILIKKLSSKNKIYIQDER